VPTYPLLAEFEAFASAFGFAAMCFSIAAFYIVVEWRKARAAKLEADLKREMIQKGLSVDEIERILKATGPKVE